MNECQKIIKKYFNGSSNLISSKVYEDYNILQHIEQYGNKKKGPDLISKVNNKIYGIEHFEFDSAKRNRKGSSYRKQTGEIDNLLNQEIKEKEYVHKTSILALNQNIQDYVKNYKESYNSHSSRIPSYLKNLNNDFPNFDKEIWFFIEDVTPFGNHYYDKNCKPVLFTPMLSQELIELFEENKQIKNIVFATSDYGNVKNIFVYSNTENEINELKKRCKEESVKGLFSQNPLLISIEKKLKISKNEN